MLRDKIKVLKLIVDNALAEAVVAVGINYFQIKEATLKRHNAAFLTELTEQGWQNQLTVVTSFLTIANNKRENATFAMNNNSLYSKLALIEASKHANTALLTEIQTLEAYKRTDTDSATVDNFNQQYQISALVASVYCKCTSCGVVPHPYQLTRKDLIQ
jgi:hypothetical protein